MSNKTISRRDFLQTGTALGIALGLRPLLSPAASPVTAAGKRIGMIGLDTSHAVEFTKTLNAAAADGIYDGYRITAAYPYGSRRIPSSYNRIKSYTQEVQQLGVKIMPSIEAMLAETDVIMLETNDGGPHPEQARLVLEARKPVFIDKPVAASLRDAINIYEQAGKYNVPIFSSSTLRYVDNMESIRNGSLAGKVIGAETYSPCETEPSHPDLFWYGVHGVEMLFAAMGTGCRKVSRVHTADTDIVTGIWEDGRTGTFRGTRSGVHAYGGMVYGDKANAPISGYSGYAPLLQQIIKFFRSGIPPVTPEETLQIYAFMDAADTSRKRKGKTVSMIKI